MPLPSESTYQLSRLRDTDPTAWRAKVRAALAATLSFDDAGKQLGVPGRTLRRWADADPAIVRDLAMRPSGQHAPSAARMVTENTEKTNESAVTPES